MSFVARTFKLYQLFTGRDLITIGSSWASLNRRTLSSKTYCTITELTGLMSVEASRLLALIFDFSRHSSRGESVGADAFG